MINKQAEILDRWIIFPDGLTPPSYRGYITRDDISRIKGAFPIGQNIQFTDGMTPTVRPGSILVGTKKIGATPIKRAWRFERRDGVEIEMRYYNGIVDFLILNEMTEYKNLQEGLTDTENMCYAVISKSTIVPSYVYYCNGIDDWFKWSGAFVKYASDNGSNIITVNEVLAEPAYLQGGALSDDITAFTSINNGSFRITINGTGYNVDGLNFTANTTLDDVAATMQVGLRTATSRLETVTYSSNKKAFRITTVDSNSSAITVATTSTGTVGTDISGEGSPLTRLKDSFASVFNRKVFNFTTTGAIVINNDKITYTGISGSTFTGCSKVPTTPNAGDIIVQSAEQAGLPDVVGSVGIAHEGRIHARLETKQSVSNCSKLNDPDNWTIDSLDGSANAKEIEQGGPITAYGRDEKNLYIFKKRQIKTLQFKQSGERVDVPVYENFKPSDDKSTTTGAIGQKSTFHSPNGILFVTEDKELIHLTREADIDYPQLVSISDTISPTFKTGSHDSASGIVYKSKVYYAFKQDENSDYNDVVIVYDLIRKIWHTPYIGWNVNDWTILNNKLRWHSSINANTYELQTDFLDNGSAYTTILRTHAEDFGEPFLQKTIDAIALELYLSDNFKGMVTVLYDDDGFTGQTEIEIDLEDKESLDTKHVLKNAEYNMFGSSPFGSQRFGSNENLEGLKRHIFIIPLKPNVQFFSVSTQISTDKENCNYELVRNGYRLHSIYKIDPNKFIKNII